LNQDSLKNLFAILRNRSGRNDNPSAMEFRRNLQYAMTANLMKLPAGTNCEIDGTDSVLLAAPNLEYQNGSSNHLNLLRTGIFTLKLTFFLHKICT